MALVSTDATRQLCIDLENVIGEWVADHFTEEMLPEIKQYFGDGTVIVLIEQIIEDF